MIKCQVCNKEFLRLKTHLKKQHGLSLNQYVKLYPNQPTVDPEYQKRMRDKAKKNNLAVHLKPAKKGDKRALKTKKGGMR